MSEEIARRCLRCDVDLTDVMGVQVFISAPPPREVEATGYLLCLEHGGNGINVIKRAEFSALVAMANTRAHGRGNTAEADEGLLRQALPYLRRHVSAAGLVEQIETVLPKQETPR